jgi:hypothetical protein
MAMNGTEQIAAKLRELAEEMRLLASTVASDEAGQCAAELDLRAADVESTPPPLQPIH